jgi:predicted PurR-regulated permease PerM
VNETIRLLNRTHLPPSQIEGYVRSTLAEAPSVLQAVLLGLGHFSADLLLVCVIVFFLLWGRAAAHVHMEAVIDPLDTPRTAEAHRLHLQRIVPSRLQGSIQAQIRLYFQLKSLTSLLLGAVVGVTLLALGVPGSGFFGIITGLANYVPVFGGPIAALLPLPVLILDPDISLTRGFLALALPIGIHTVLANVVEPVLFGAGHGAEGTELDPTIMLISMSVWHQLWGLAGLVLAVPLTICLRLLFHDLDQRHASSTGVFGMLDRMLAGEFVFDESK